MWSCNLRPFPCLSCTLQTSHETFLIYLSVLYMAALRSRPLDEIEGGLLTTIENHAIAVTVDDFLMAPNSPNGAKRTKLP